MLEPYSFNLLTTSALGLVLFLLLLTLRQKKGALPPGPKGKFIIGNFGQLPKVNSWLTYTEWAKIYGDLIYVEVLRKPIIVINTAAAAKEILGKHSLISSKRPHLVLASELIGFNDSFTMKQYGDEWRQQRKLMAQEFSPAAVLKYSAIQEKQARLLACNLVKNPSTMADEITLRIAVLIFRATYGYYLETTEDPMLQVSQKNMKNFIYCTTPGNFLVDIFPILKYVPSWFPGAGFKNFAAECRKTRLSALWKPYIWSKKALENGDVLLPNLFSTILTDARSTLQDKGEERLAFMGGSVQGGGQDTNISATLNFFLAMLQNPEVQRKARAEIDAVIGLDRLPKLSDRPSLPYVRSLLTEVFRIHPSAPLGLPHVLSEDGIYEGFHLPKGSMLIPNVWAMLHNPEVYENPMEFMPERYNNSDAEMKKVTDLIFGFGRRACPGSGFAENSLFAIVSTVLATCEILPPLDKQGKPVIQNVGFTSGTISFPEAFEIRMKYRSQNAMNLLAETSTLAE